jgi:hypothetical protein
MRVTRAVLSSTPGRAVVALGCASLLAACNYTDSARAQDLCARYDDLAASVNTLLDTRPVSAKADEIRQRADDVTTQLDEFQAVSEGRFDTALSAVRADVAAMKEAAVKAGAEARDAARPQFEDVLTDLADAWAFVADLADTQCGKTR